MNLGLLHRRIGRNDVSQHIRHNSRDEHESIRRSQAASSSLSMRSIDTPTSALKTMDPPTPKPGNRTVARAEMPLLASPPSLYEA